MKLPIDNRNIFFTLKKEPLPREGVAAPNFFVDDVLESDQLTSS